jgi:hypothetical protein
VAAAEAAGGGDLPAGLESIRLGSPLPPPPPSALPPLLPASARAAAATAEEEEDSIQLGLHALSSGTLPQD